ncbi:MAG: ribosome silencing factor [Bacteroidota bacterium]
MPQDAESSHNQFTNPYTEEAQDSQELIDTIAQAMLDKKAENVTVLDVRGLTTLTDYFVVCHANADVQIKAIANSVMEKVKEELGEDEWRKEGLDTRRWVILDYVNVVVHIFNKQQREYYGLERMWNDAKITHIKDEEQN